MQGLVEGRIDIGVMYTPQSRPGLKVEQLFEEQLILVSTDPRSEPEPQPGYVYVDWGPEFYARHSAFFPNFAGPSLTANIGWLGLQHVLENGGSGFFARRIVEPLLKTRRLHAVAGAPEFSMPAYVVYPLDRQGDHVSSAIEIMHRIAEAQKTGGGRAGGQTRRAQAALIAAVFVSALPIAAIAILRLSKRRAGSDQTMNRADGAMNIPSGLGDALLNSASDAIIATDREGRITFWNPGAERIFGFTAAEATGQIARPDHSRKSAGAALGRLSPYDGDGNQPLRSRRSVVGAWPDQGRPADLGRIHHRDAAQQTAGVTGTVAVMRDVTKRFEELRELKRRLARPALHDDRLLVRPAGLLKQLHGVDEGLRDARKQRNAAKLQARASCSVVVCEVEYSACFSYAPSGLPVAATSALIWPARYFGLIAR